MEEYMIQWDFGSHFFLFIVYHIGQICVIIFSWLAVTIFALLVFLLGDVLRESVSGDLVNKIQQMIKKIIQTIFSFNFDLVELD